jgi:cation transport regulator ChaC
VRPVQLVFGYGSLSAERSGTRCRLRDHRRDWDVAMDNRETIPGYKIYVDPETGERPAVHVAYLSIVPAAGECVDGVAFRVTDDELAALDRRERNYDRRDVTHLIDAGLAGRVWAYVGSADGRRRLADARRRGTAVVARGYLEKVPSTIAVPPDLPVRALLRRDIRA